MIIVHDPRCADYGSDDRPEQPARTIKTADYLRTRHQDWVWEIPERADDNTVCRVHTAEHLARLRIPRPFDSDTPYFDGIADHALASVGAALRATDHALKHRKAFALMRPPGHHALADRAMGFCYLNQGAVAAFHARAAGAARVAVWDFDAHHGNGTEAILRDREGFLYVSVHQYPGYPGTGTESFSNCVNFPVPPLAPRAQHQEALRRSWDAVVAFHPDLVLVSAGFDAYVRDPITSMTLEEDDFAELGRWLKQADAPAAAVLEGGYSGDLPKLVDSFLTAWF